MFYVVEQGHVLKEYGDFWDQTGLVWNDSFDGYLKVQFTADFFIGFIKHAKEFVSQRIKETGVLPGSIACMDDELFALLDDEGVLLPPGAYKH